MTDPRTPQTNEALLPDALDQTPDSDPPGGEHGSEDARLLAGADQAEGDVARETAPEEAAPVND